MSTEFVSILLPPGDSISGYNFEKPDTEQDSSIPTLFCEAHSVRRTVFVEEQGVAIENEIDADDPRCFHWIAYASVGNSGPDDAASKVPIGTIRLVPPPHPPHPIPGSDHQIDNSESSSNDPIHPEPAEAFADPAAGEGTSYFQHDSSTPYIKLGRLAVLPAYRSLGLSRLLINTALDFAAKNPDQITPNIDPTLAEKLRFDPAAAEKEEGLTPGLRNVVPEKWNGLVLVHAQKSVEGLWAKNGFKKDELMGEWDEEGIQHVGMWRRVKVRQGSAV